MIEPLKWLPWDERTSADRREATARGRAELARMLGIPVERVALKVTDDAYLVECAKGAAAAVMGVTSTRLQVRIKP